MKKYDVYEKVDCKELKDVENEREIFCGLDTGTYKVIKMLEDGRAIDVSDDGAWRFNRYLKSKI